jgi:hypothetical protein
VRAGSHLIRPSEINNKKGPDALWLILLSATENASVVYFHHDVTMNDAVSLS